MFNDSAMNVAATAIAADITHISLHTTGAVSSSSDESAAGREAISWTVAANGDMSAGPIAFTGGASSGPVVRVGYWTAASGGTYRGGFLLTGDTAFNASGEYTVDSILEDATAT